MPDPTDVDEHADKLTDTKHLSAPKPEDGPQPDFTPPPPAVDPEDA